MSTRDHTAAIVVATLAGTLALGACGTQRTTSEEVTRELPRSARSEVVEAEAVRLQELRTRYPTAGAEVPPADLVRTDMSGTRGSSPLTRPTSTHRYVQ